MTCCLSCFCSLSTSTDKGRNCSIVLLGHNNNNNNGIISLQDIYIAPWSPKVQMRLTAINKDSGIDIFFSVVSALILSEHAFVYFWALSLSRNYYGKSCILSRQ